MKTKTIVFNHKKREIIIDRNQHGFLLLSMGDMRHRYLYYTEQEAIRLFKKTYEKTTN